METLSAIKRHVFLTRGAVWLGLNSAMLNDIRQYQKITYCQTLYVKGSKRQNCRDREQIRGCYRTEVEEAVTVTGWHQEIVECTGTAPHPDCHGVHTYQPIC